MRSSSSIAIDMIKYICLHFSGVGWKYVSNRYANGDSCVIAMHEFSLHGVEPKSGPKLAMPIESSLKLM